MNALLRTTSFSLLTAASCLAHSATVDFENIILSAESNTPVTFDGNIDSGGASFAHNYTPFLDASGNVVFEAWDGFAVSNITDNSTPGFGNQYSAITGSGANSSNYAVSFCFSCSTFVDFGGDVIVNNAEFTNTTYTFTEISNGNNAFGLSPFSAANNDFLKVTVAGLDSFGVTTNALEFFLADGDDFVDFWKLVDLSSLGVVAGLKFDVTASQAGAPSYFAIDNLNYQAVPLPAGIYLFASSVMLIAGLRTAKKPV